MNCILKNCLILTADFSKYCGKSTADFFKNCGKGSAVLFILRHFTNKYLNIPNNTLVNQQFNSNVFLVVFVLLILC